MILFAVTLQALAPLFGLIVLGYLLKKARVLHAAHAPVLNGLVVNATLPALVLHSLLHAGPISRGSVTLPFIVIISELLTAVFAFGVSRAMGLSRAQQGGAILVSAFGNTGFLGYPITMAVMPAMFTAAVLIDNFGMAMPLYSSAPVIGSTFGTASGSSKEMLKRLARSPILNAAVLGIILSHVRIPDPVAHNEIVAASGDAIDKCLVLLGQGTTPLVLLALGVSLQPGTVGKFKLPLLLTCSAKLVLSPLLVWLMCLVMPLTHSQMAVAVMISAMPTSVMASVLAGQYDLDGDFAVATVFLTTLLSAIAVPLWLAVVR